MAKKKMGRPPTDIPLDVLNTACSFNANANQIIMLLEQRGIHITDDTLTAHCKRNFGMTFSEYRDKRFDNTRLMLTQKTMKMALEGNVTLLIFCLKNLCGWSDKVESKEEDKKPFELAYDPTQRIKK